MISTTTVEPALLKGITDDSWSTAKVAVQVNYVPSLFAVLSQMAGPTTHCAHNSVGDDTLGLLQLLQFTAIHNVTYTGHSQ